MNIITKPTVTIVGETEFFETDQFDIPDDGEDANKLVSFAAKICYDSNGKEGRPNCENNQAILEHRHGSVLEHYYVSLYITGITRGLTLEMNRHRPLGISQRSTRYTKEEDASIVLEPYYAQLYHSWVDSTTAMSPPLDVDDRDKSEFIHKHIEDQRNKFAQYRREVRELERFNPENLSGFELRKWARGKARNGLPHCLETRCVYTGNLRAWRWFLEARCNRHAEAEIRRLAFEIYVTLKMIPMFFDDFVLTQTDNGLYELIPKYSKV